jgi:hypothetical protein
VTARSADLFEDGERPSYPVGALPEELDERVPTLSWPAFERFAPTSVGIGQPSGDLRAVVRRVQLGTRSPSGVEERLHLRRPLIKLFR